MRGGAILFIIFVSAVIVDLLLLVHRWDWLVDYLFIDT